MIQFNFAMWLNELDMLEREYDNYKRKWLNENSGGNIVFVSIGAQSFYKHYGAKVMYNIPLSQHYASGNVTVKPRVEANLYFLF